MMSFNRAVTSRLSQQEMLLVERLKLDIPEERPFPEVQKSAACFLEACRFQRASRAVLRYIAGVILIVYFCGCAPIPQIYDARTLHKGERNITLGYGGYARDDVVQHPSGAEEAAVAPIPLNYSIGYGLSDSLELGGTLGIYMAGGHFGLYSKFQLFDSATGFAGALYADAGLYGMMHAITGYSVNGGVLLSYALPDDFALDVCWTSGLGIRVHNFSDGGYADSKIHRKSSEGIYIPVSMKVGKWGWFLFGTVGYPISENAVYQVEEADVEFVKHPKLDYLIGLGYTF